LTKNISLEHSVSVGQVRGSLQPKNELNLSSYSDTILACDSTHTHKLLAKTILAQYRASSNKNNNNKTTTDERV